MNREQALGRLGGRAELLASLVELFLVECPKLIGVMDDAVARADGPALMRAAHTLKGSTGVFGDDPLADVALRLERIGKSGELDEAAAVLADLRVAAERAVGDLNDW